ncbi:MAG TPA: DEAD/DEAH box helicase family protein [Acidimicrobiia bacterium]|nr:DEAD/DEAH box helicase family protein [Acidimicrobiia bacterium]
MGSKIDKLIINSPYLEPAQHWYYDRETQSFDLIEGRRKAGYVIATPNSQSFDDPGIFKEIEIANQIRGHLVRWQNDGRPGLTGISKRLLEHWTRAERDQKFFYCQIEAIETLLFLNEAPDTYKVGIDIPSDGSAFPRWCSKMATGTGKTVVMAMLVAINIINKNTYRKDTRFSKNILLVAPGLTVKSRLSVLQPSDSQNYYDVFDIVPADLKSKLYEGKVKVINWHMLMPLKEQLRSVVKIGEESDEAFTRRVLDDMASARNLLVINDEAHHAWRLKPGESEKDYIKHEIAAKDATRWMEGLDRIHKTRGLIRCHDLSATPFRPMGSKSDEELLFGWIVSDFGLNDAIESGLVKTPRIVVRSDSMNIDAKTMKPKLYHIYKSDEVSKQLGKELETEPLPDLIRNAYQLLAKDWQETKDAWKKEGHDIPPVMITVCNRTETAARIEHSFNLNRFEGIDDLKEKVRTLRIDSKVLESAEEKSQADTDQFAGKKKDAYRIHLEEIVAANTSLSTEERERLANLKNEELLREIVDSVGKPRAAGEQIQHVIAVAMLSEGWDTKNVTHIMGLRAFSSQLLCEQVVGRGLRRVNYEINQETGLYDPEYVNIFGVPFSFLPNEGTDDTPPPPPAAQTRVEVVPSKFAHEIIWPNVLRIEYKAKVEFSTTLDGIEKLVIDSSKVDTYAELAAVLEGKTTNTMSKIDLQEFAEKYRLQYVVFKVAAEIVEKLSGQWQGKSRMDLLPKVISLAEEFIESEKLAFTSLLDEDPMRRKVMVMLSMNKIVQHIADSILLGSEQIEATELVFDRQNVTRSTGDMATWFTRRESEPIEKSHISHMVTDGSWEMAVSRVLDVDQGVGKYVESWVKNDHLGFEIPYMWNGTLRRYIPDFLIQLNNDVKLVLEVKGLDSPQNQRKRKFLDEWVKAVNADGRFGTWAWDVLFDPSELDNIILKHNSE